MTQVTADVSAARPPALAVATLTVRVAASPSDFPEWPRSDRVGEARCHVFQCADILQVWLDTIGAARRTRALFVGVREAAGEPVMLLPLGIERRGGARVLGFLDGTVVDYSQPVLFPRSAAIDAEAMDALWTRIRAALPPFDLAVLDKMPETVGDLANPLLHLPTRPMPESGHAMSLTGSRDELDRRIPMRKRQRSHIKQLARTSTIGFTVAEAPEPASRYLEAMIANKTRRFAETRVPGFEVPGKLDFYREATARLPLLAPVHLSAIEVDGTLIASHWGLVYGDRFYFLMTAYADGIWRKYAPGLILNAELIRWCHANGCRWFDFGIGDEAYKDEYCDVTIPLHVARIPVSLRGRLRIRADTTLAALRASALWQRLRPYKWVLRRAFTKNR